MTGATSSARSPGEGVSPTRDGHEARASDALGEEMGDRERADEIRVAP